MTGRRRNETMSVSLFPFLAVLICTMGILIILLVLAVKSAEVTAIEASEDQQATAEQAEQLQAQLQDEQLRNESLLLLRPDLQQRLARERDKRGQMEDNVSQLEEELRATQKKHQQLRLVAQSPIESNTTDNSIDQLTSMIDETVSKTNALRESNKGEQPTTYSIVPYSGGSGTSRKPIYIECTKDGLLIQPGAVLLTENDFTIPVLPGNPLDACLLRIRQYQRRHQLEGDSGQSYPLLVVRPGGESYFALARRAMKSWDDEFGYELVEQQKQLDFGEADQRLVVALNETINESLRSQTRMVAIMESRGQTFEKFATQMSRAGSGGTSIETGQGDSNSPGGSMGGSYDESGMDESPNNQSELAETGDLKQESGDGNAAASSQVGSQSTEAENIHAAETSLANDSEAQSKSGRSSSFQPNTKAGETAGNMNVGQAPSQIAQPVSESRGENWALPSTTANAIAYRRPIRVDCGPDRLIINPGDNSNLQRTVIPIQDSLEKSLDPFVQSIWTVIESWGIAGSGGYWKPVLTVNVMPGGQSNQLQLKRLLQDSGLEVDK